MFERKIFKAATQDRLSLRDVLEEAKQIIAFFKENGFKLIEMELISYSSCALMRVKMKFKKEEIK